MSTTILNAVLHSLLALGGLCCACASLYFTTHFVLTLSGVVFSTLDVQATAALAVALGLQVCQYALTPDSPYKKHPETYKARKTFALCLYALSITASVATFANVMSTKMTLQRIANENTEAETLASYHAAVEKMTLYTQQVTTLEEQIAEAKTSLSTSIKTQRLANEQYQEGLVELHKRERFSKAAENTSSRDTTGLQADVVSSRKHYDQLVKTRNTLVNSRPPEPINPEGKHIENAPPVMLEELPPWAQWLLYIAVAMAIEAAVAFALIMLAPTPSQSEETLNELPEELKAIADRILHEHRYKITNSPTGIETAKHEGRPVREMQRLLQRMKDLGLLRYSGRRYHRPDPDKPQT